MSPLLPPAALSFRDPEGYLERGQGDHVIRHLHPGGMETWRRVQASPAIRSLQEEGRWIHATEVPGDPTRLQHPRVFFPSYPHEWSPSMLHRAAALTLAANEALLGEDLELKDATPSNILFEGTRALFVDHLSPAPREPLALGWRAYGQFCRTFLIPLLLHRRRGLPLSWMFLANRDGVPPEAALPLLSPWDRMRSPAFGLVTMPAWFARREAAANTTPKAQSGEIAALVNRRMLKGLGKHLARLKPAEPDRSTWSDYQDLGISYTPEGLEAKHRFIQEVLSTHTPATVLDLGCNTGRFSKLAARHGARVVAMDFDPACVDRLFVEAEAEGLDLQPLVVNLGRPSPALGWNNHEEASLLDRLEGRFEMVFALALIHHLLVRERIPLDSVMAFLARTTAHRLLVEWVEPVDPQFQRIAGPSKHLYEDLTEARFEAAFAPHFRKIGSVRIPGSPRTLFLLETL